MGTVIFKDALQYLTLTLNKTWKKQCCGSFLTPGPRDPGLVKKSRSDPG